MADYRSILNRAISGLDENNEDARRGIYDKARKALMRQLSSLEPALSPAEISKQRLQLEEAVRDIENKHSGAGVFEDAVSNALLNEDDGAVIESTAGEPQPAVPEPTPLPTPEVAPVIEPGGEDVEPASGVVSSNPWLEPESSPDPASHVTPEISHDDDSNVVEVQVEEVEPAAVTTTHVTDGSKEVGTSPDAVDEPLLPPAKDPVFDSAAPPASNEDTSLSMDTSDDEKPSDKEPDEPLDLVDEATAVLARVDTIKAGSASALDELRETMAADGVAVTPTPEVSLTASKAGDTADKEGAAAVKAQDPAVAAAATKKSGGGGLVWILILLVLVGAGAFSWAQRETIGPIVMPVVDQIRGIIIGSGTPTSPGSDAGGTSKDPAKGDDDTPADEEPQSNKAEDRILTTPIEETTTAEPEEDQSGIKLGNRVALPDSSEPNAVPIVRPVVPANKPDPTTPQTPAPAVEQDQSTNETPATPPAPTVDQDAGENTEAATATPQEPAQTAVPNLFASSAILYEERSNGGRPDVSTGIVVWELVPTGSEAIGSEGLPSVRGKARIQNRDLSIRFELMRNLDDTLPASHLIEMEFSPGPLFTGDTISNIAGISMKENEQESGKQLAGAVVKVSESVFWVAMSSRAADLASNSDALKVQKWFDIPILFTSGKRAILTLEKGAAGAKAIEAAFAAWGS